MKRHVLIFSTTYFPNIGGAEVAIKEITDRLGDYDFELICARLEPQLPSKELIGKVLVHRLGFGNSFDKLLILFLGVIKIWQIDRSRPIKLFWSVMVTYASGAPYIFNILRFWKKIPIVLTLQEGDSEEHLTKRHFGLLDMSWRLSIPRSTAISAISHYLASRAKRFGYRGEPYVVPNGVSDDYFDVPKQKTDGKAIVTTSRLVHKNGIDTLIRAMALLPEHNLVIAGDGEERERLETLTRELNLESRVKFLGTVSREDLPKLLASADIFCRSSRSEGQGISFLEAMAAGLPVIATKVGGIPDFLTDRETGLFCKVSNPESIAEKVKELMGDQALCGKIIKNARELMRNKFTWDKISEQMKEVFSSDRSLRITIASPLAPGSNTVSTRYASELTKELKTLGHKVNMATFSNRLPTGLRHFWFFLRLVFTTADFIIALDNYSVAWPSLWVGKLARRKVIIRIGGDFLWESYVNRTGNLVPLSSFYQTVKILNLKEKVIKSLTQFVYTHANKIVFSTEWQRNITLDAYNINANKIHIITNAYGHER
ncbi:MAG TPA: glycosyltransferase [Candidatus Paceibacterota bacterium]